MRNTVLLCILCFAFAGFAAAQSATPSPDTKASANLPWDESTLTGCLQQKMGRYILVDEEGAAHELSGSYGKLKHQLEHQIEVTGKPGTRNVDSTAPGGASSVIVKPVFEVKSIKQLADTCK